MNSKVVSITESELKNIIKEQVKTQLLIENFHIAYDKVKRQHHDNNRPFGFELRRNGEWEYGDIEYDAKTNQLICMGVSITVDLSLSFRDNLEDLYEKMCENGFDTDY